MPPSAFPPWQREHLAAKSSRPAATVPEPSGNPLPSGAIEAPRLRISSAVAGRPTPYFCDCAVMMAAPANAITPSFHIGHGPVGIHFPELHAVVVITDFASIWNVKMRALPSGIRSVYFAVSSLAMYG